MLKRVAIGLASAALAIAATGAAMPTAASAATAFTAHSLLDSYSRSLLGTHADLASGWAWQSQLQYPHYQTDRDVGASGVGAGLLAVYAATHDRTYLEAARRAGDWLLAVAHQDGSDLAWPDYVDPSSRSATEFTSFDDGAPGIADFLWQVAAASGDERYRRAADAAIEWTIDQAEGVAGHACPQVCRWDYFNDANEYRTGIGEGMAGIVFALDSFAQREHRPRLARYAIAGARYLESLMTPEGAMPERPGQRQYDAGFLHGAAGDAFTFLALYQHTHNQRWRDDAARLLAWVNQSADRTPQGVAWPIEIADGVDRNDALATGFEEGAAGIGWVQLQAYRLTGDTLYLQRAQRAGEWLLSVAPDAAHTGWPEDFGESLFHTGLNNGAAGIGWYLHDLAPVTGDARFDGGATAALTWLHANATGRGASVFEYRDPTGPHLYGEPSWHWGSAGIAAFAARMAGSPIDAPGEEPALTP